MVTFIIAIKTTTVRTIITAVSTIAYKFYFSLDFHFSFSIAFAFNIIFAFLVYLC